MSSNTNNSAIPPARSLPKDALIIQTMLQEMGVTNYEPQVINQLLEFQYRYVSDILDDAKIFSQHANKKVIDSDDIKLAVQCKLDHSFTNPPPRDVLMDLARHKNSTPLPLIKPFTGTRLPPDRYCLINTNFRLASKKVHRPTLSFGGGGLGGMLGGGGGGGRMRFNISQPSVARSTSVSGGSVIPKPLITPMFAIKPGTAASTTSARPMPTIRLTSGPSLGGSTGSTGLPTASGSTTTDHPLTSFTSQLSADPGGMMGGALKRKRDEDDDYDDLNNL